MAACEPGGRLSYANVADVDAATDSLGGLESLRHIDEPAWIQAGGVLEKDDGPIRALAKACVQFAHRERPRSEEHTSELQSHLNLVCRLLLVKKKEHNLVDKLIP